MLIFLSLLSSCAAAPAQKPNIIWFLTDDQDRLLGGSFPQIDGQGPMAKTKALMAAKGATAERFYIHTPICNPSRSELLSGRYFHNIKTTDTPWANMHVNETLPHNHSFMRMLHDDAGYTTGMFGKFMNRMPTSVPPGYDAWMANAGGNYIAPSFQLYNTDGLSPHLTKTGSTRPCWHRDHSDDAKYGCYHGSTSNYTTSVVGNVSMAWIRKSVSENPKRPFFAYIAPKAAHEPFNPAPWYEGVWEDHWPQHEPRPVNWNCSAKSRSDHPGVIATEPLLTDEAATVITGIFKNRWRTLLSVDDLIADVIGLCEELGVADNTYFFYSSDHGFQLGNFNILMDKRHVYEWDTRIHLLARGPGIPPGSTWTEPATQVDMAPTFLGLAGLKRADQFDGKSLVPLLIPSASAHAAPSSTRDHLLSMGASAQYKASWRDTVFIEYYYNDPNVKCTEACKPIPPGREYPNADSNCGDLTPGHNEHCWAGSCKKGCYATESPANNYIGIRTMPNSPFGDRLYAEYQTGNQAKADIDFKSVDFKEMYNNTADPWQMHNMMPGDEDADKLHALLHTWFACAGDTCP